MPTVRFDFGNLCLKIYVWDLIRRSLRRGEGYGRGGSLELDTLVASLRWGHDGGRPLPASPPEEELPAELAADPPEEEFQEPVPEDEPAAELAAANCRKLRWRMNRQRNWLRAHRRKKFNNQRRGMSSEEKSQEVIPFRGRIFDLIYSEHLIFSDQFRGCPTICLRPGFGLYGKQVKVEANHFLLTFGAVPADHLPVNIYDVTITPHVASKDLRRSLVRKVIKFKSWCTRGRLAFDGWQSLYVAGLLPDAESAITYTDPLARRKCEYIVSIKLGSALDLRELLQFIEGRQSKVSHEILHVLDVVLRESPSDRHAVVGRSFFSSKDDDVLASGLVYHNGFCQSLHATQMGMSLNIDTFAKAFFGRGLLQTFVRRQGIDLTKNLREMDRIMLEKVLKDVTVETDYRSFREEYKFVGITKESLSDLKLPLHGIGSEIGLDEYFRKKYYYLLWWPKFPAIQVCDDTGSILLLPIEACRISKGQRYIHKLNERQVIKLLNATCKDRKKRQLEIRNTVARNNYNKYIAGFGIQVTNRMTSIDARVLSPPTLKYHGTGTDSEVVPSDGQWSMKDKKMIEGGNMEFWACINFSTKLDNIDAGNFCCDLMDMCRSKGMECGREPVIPTRFCHPNGIKNALFNIEAETTSAFAKLNVTNKRLQLLVVILHEKRDIYGKIKRICETELGIVSQCFKPGSIAKSGEEYVQMLENVSLKMNAKVGGRNCVLMEPLIPKLPLDFRPTIIFGAAVTHPQPGDVSSLSIAGVVASMDWPHVAKYRGLASAQTPGDEIIKDLYSMKEDSKSGIIHGGMIREHLLSFQVINRHAIPPKRLIYYRDGVSEGQVTEVHLHELNAIKKACESIYGDERPKITFILVQKRHHTRLFPARHKGCNTTDRSGNVLPGTVVDRQICHPTEFDFYLCSHAGVEGTTSCPTHYHVLYDENRFVAHRIQMITNNLCYTGARCTRSLAVVTPVYYAHLLARRARCYVEGDGATTSSTRHKNIDVQCDDSDSNPSCIELMRNEQVPSLPEVKANIKDFMFFI